VTARLDRQQSARFLSYAGILLEFWRRILAAEALAASDESQVSVCGFSGNAVSNRKQTAVGSKAGRRARNWIVSQQLRSNRVILRNVWPDLGPGVREGPDQAPSPFPETNFSSHPAERRLACALTGCGGLRPMGAKDEEWGLGWQRVLRFSGFFQAAGLPGLVGALSDFCPCFFCFRFCTW
jgi:hypothetical protein